MEERTFPDPVNIVSSEWVVDLDLNAIRMSWGPHLHHHVVVCSFPSCCRVA